MQVDRLIVKNITYCIIANIHFWCGTCTRKLRPSWVLAILHCAVSRVVIIVNAIAQHAEKRQNSRNNSQLFKYTMGCFISFLILYFVRKALKNGVLLKLMLGRWGGVVVGAPPVQLASIVGEQSQLNRHCYFHHLKLAAAVVFIYKTCI